MTDSHAHAIGRDAVQAQTKQHIARVANVVAQAHRHLAHPFIAGHGRDVFDLEGVVMMRSVFSIRRQSVRAFASQQV